ncbi:DUF4230 domain-containing protein [Faecalicoccus pleomorphus]|uniref:DUF4230 domain-containing protein n=1 Tax=Faecalicoccus pleomorphus TaxID=1323 RepID=UPI00242F6E4F|nr:DUF4230 domain-containing protein [Faecalicoccus pleomorphus]MDM8292917.1 DUF4230 domain-containing protein [Faecalicoccus pleomorphus]
MTKQIEEENQKRSSKLSKILKMITPKGAIIIILIVCILGVGIGLGKSFFTDSKTTKLGFEDIGELATQSAYSSNTSVIDQSRDLFGFEIPFTQSKYVFSYDTVIKAGINFSDITWKVDENNKKIKINLPETKVLSNEIDEDSLKVYHESESIFTNIELEETNKALSNLKDTAEKNAIENGLLENATMNAQTLVKSFVGQVYDLNTYQVIFE